MSQSSILSLPNSYSLKIALITHAQHKPLAANILRHGPGGIGRVVGNQLAVPQLLHLLLPAHVEHADLAGFDFPTGMDEQPISIMIGGLHAVAMDGGDIGGTASGSLTRRRLSG